MGDVLNIEETGGSNDQGDFDKGPIVMAIRVSQDGLRNCGSDLLLQHIPQMLDTYVAPHIMQQKMGFDGPGDLLPLIRSHK